jgi:hypothetical protein
MSSYPMPNCLIPTSTPGDTLNIGSTGAVVHVSNY